MGYYSDVTVTLTGNEEECKDLLNAYKLTETKEQIEGAWHLLDAQNLNTNGSIRFFYEAIECNDPVVQLTWHFAGVKWYSESDRALHRLGSLLEGLQTEDENQTLAITMQRLGENPDDYEENHWGESPFDYENPVDVVRQFEVQAPVAEINPIKLLFKNNEGK